MRRDELYSSGGPDQSENRDQEGDDEELRARLRAQLSKSLYVGHSDEHTETSGMSRLDVEELGANGSSGGDADDFKKDGGKLSSGESNENREDGYEFRLFSTAEAAPKVLLEDEDEFQGDGAIVNPRPASYYLATEVAENLKQEYGLAALSGEDVEAQSGQKCWGMEMPWKVAHIGSTATRKPAKEGYYSMLSEETEEAAKRKRPGKNQRIRLRTKERASKAALETAAQKATEKEDHLKEKKKRMNRLKKLRKRAKDKEKKVTAKAEAGVEGSAGEVSDADTSGEGVGSNGKVDELRR